MQKFVLLAPCCFWVAARFPGNLLSPRSRQTTKPPNGLSELPSDEKVDEAADILRAYSEKRRKVFSAPPLLLGFAAVGMPQIFLVPTVALGLLSAALFRGGLLLRALRVGVVTIISLELFKLLIIKMIGPR